MTTATSPDLRLTATTDDSNAGVILQATLTDVVRTNHVSNPKFATASTYWSANDGGSAGITVTRPTSGGPAESATFYRITWNFASSSISGGPQILAVGGLGGGDVGMLCSPGVRRSVFAKVRCSKSQRIKVDLQYLTAANALLLSTTVEVVLTANTWTTVQLNQAQAAPANTAKTQLQIWSTPGTGASLWAGGDTFDITAVCVVDGAAAPATYFDGSTAAASPYAYRWTGTANASPSEEYRAAPYGLPTQVTFERDGLRVRSGDPAWAPDGNAFAYDHEAGLGASVTYRAQPIYADGTIGDWTGSVTITSPAMASAVDCWIKPCDNPSLAVAFQVHTDKIEESVQHRVQVQPVQGRALPAGTFDLRTPAPMSITLRTTTKAEKDALRDALDVGYVLVQLRSTYGIDDFYGIPLEETRRYFVGMFSAQRDIPVTFQPVGRPPTVDSSLRVPGRSYAETEDLAATYAASTAMWATYADILDL